MKKYLIIGIVIAIFGVYFFVTKEIQNLPPDRLVPPSQEKVLLRKEGIEDPLLTAEAYLSVYVGESGETTILAEKNAATSLPIASVTKLMTALVAVEKMDKNTVITISKKAVDQFETAGELQEKEKYSLQEILYPLLIESSNDAAYAIAETYGYDKFIAAMNARAAELGLASTHFVTVHGLDTAKATNDSSANDLASLITHLYNHQREILSITAQKTAKFSPLYSTTPKLLTSTNLLIDNANFPYFIVGGKTGETPKAKQALVTAIRPPENSGLLISIVLRSDNRFVDMISLVDWAVNSYNW